ncbi:R-linalool synthase QH1, chloroplastic-like [Bidens hawaiensis]|uniref:R-linalool synthase QH1, chloroplastic-like n=1 Tax=Bidens hawaiensis TaxID=980011 RepID=UPI004049795C
MITVTYTNLIIPYITSIYFFLASLLKMAQIYSSHSTLNVATTKVVNAVEPLPRRSANYAPSIWSFDDIQSLSSEYTGEAYKARADTLKEAVKMMIHKVRSPLSTLELVDDLHRLGISYHFEDEISNLLEMIYRNYYKTHIEWHKMDLNLKALGFRLLRQCGYLIPQDIFQNFKDETKDLKPHVIKDMMGVLNLYEASYHSFEDEHILDDARDFTTKYLQENQDKMDESISSLVSHALEVPLHLTVPRVETKWFIHAYENRVDMNPILIELAKLDFDMVQSVYIEDLKHASRWWRNIGWDKKLTFARDRLVECFLWTIGFNYLPHLSLGRRNVAKVIAMVTTIDDVYDVYGTLDELELFTDAINRWDINAVEELPDYMKICFLGLYNAINEITYDTLINTRILILPYIKKAWADLCKAYLIEARWYHSGHAPTLKEYLDNACVSIATSLVLIHIKFSTNFSSTQEILQWFEESKNILYYTSLICRLSDDLGTSSDEMERGDIPKSIQCYMNESGATEDEARTYIYKLIMETWKKLNKERVSAKSQVLQNFIDKAMNSVRITLFMYVKGDGHGRPNVTKSHVLSLLFNPIQGI